MVDIKLVNLMKVIVEAEWLIDENVYSDMLQVSGHLTMCNNGNEKENASLTFALELWQ